MLVDNVRTAHGREGFLPKLMAASAIPLQRKQSDLIQALNRDLAATSGPPDPVDGIIESYRLFDVPGRRGNEAGIHLRRHGGVRHQSGGRPKPERLCAPCSARTQNKVSQRRQSGSARQRDNP